MVRENTNKLLDMIEDGVLDATFVVTACLKYMSEDEVSDMMRSNEILED